MKHCSPAILLTLTLLASEVSDAKGQNRAPGLLFGFGVGAGIVDRLGTTDGADLGIDLVGRTGARISGRLSLVIEADLHHVSEAAPTLEDQSNGNSLHETTHILFGPQIDIAGGLFVRPTAGLGIHTREVFFNCPPVEGPCSGVGTSTEGGAAAGLTAGYALATASWLDLVFEASGRYSSTEDGNRAAYGVRIVTTLRPGA